MTHHKQRQPIICLCSSLRQGERLLPDGNDPFHLNPKELTTAPCPHSGCGFAATVACQSSYRKWSTPPAWFTPSNGLGREGTTRLYRLRRQSESISQRFMIDNNKALFCSVFCHESVKNLSTKDLFRQLSGAGREKRKRGKTIAIIGFFAGFWFVKKRGRK
jgi:hypothetical protein